MNSSVNKSHTNQERKEFFKEISRESFVEANGEIPPLNKSFMGKPTNNIEKKRKKHVQIVAMAAAALLCVGIVITPLINTEQAYGDKGILHRIYQSIMGIETEGINYKDGLRESKVEISDMKDIDEACDLCKDLYIPKYMVAGYELESLIVEKIEESDTVVNYTFKSGEKGILICMMFGNEDSTYGSNSQGEIIKLNDRILHVSDSGDCVEVYTEEGIMMVSGDCSQDEMVEIARNLKKQ